MNSRNFSIPHANYAFKNLPFDTIVHIMSFVDPHDILALRKCCKKLYEASCRRVVWMNALEYAIVRSDIFRPSFLLDQMSIKELEHAATSPHRFSARLIRELNPNSVIIPRTTRIFIPFEENTFIRDMFLIPGGRFLITLDESGFSKLWDLGFGAYTEIEHHLLATIHIQDCQPTILAQPNFDGSGILVLFVTGDNALQVYEVFPTSSLPHFRLISEKRTASDDWLEVLCFHSDTILFRQNGAIFLWNFSKNAWITWNYNGDEDDYLNAILTSSEVILIDYTCISIWVIPSVQPFEAEVKAIEHNKPLLLLAYDTVYSDNETIPFNVSFCQWTSYFASISTPTFGIMATDSEGEVVIKQYIFPTIQGRDDSLPSTIPVQACSYPVGNPQRLLWPKIRHSIIWQGVLCLAQQGLSFDDEHLCNTQMQ